MNCIKLLKETHHNDIIRVFNKHSINVTFEKTGSRAVFSCNRYIRSPTPIQRECNGLVVDLDERVILAYPPAPLVISTPGRFPTVPENSRVTEVNDGTVVTLYFYGSWRMSTNRAYDVNDICQFGHSVTYWQVFKDIAELCEVNIENFDKNFSYTICMCSQLLHPYENRDTLYLVDVFDKTGTRIESAPGTEMLPKQQQVVDYDRALMGFGFIADMGTVRFLYEGAIMKNIRRIYYSKQLTSELAELNIKNKKLYVTLRYLLAGSTEFCDTFTRFRDYHNMMDVALDNMEKSIFEPTHERVLVHLAKKWPVKMLEKNPILVREGIRNPNMLEFLYAEFNCDI